MMLNHLQSYMGPHSRRLFSTAAKNPEVFITVSRNGENIGKMTFEVGIFPLTENTFSSTLMLFPRQLRTSDHSVQVITSKDTLIRRATSTESFQDSWLKVVTSPEAMELAEFLFMEQNSQMRTSKSSTLREDSCPWPMQAPTQMDLNSSLPLVLLTGKIFHPAKPLLTLNCD